MPKCFFTDCERNGLFQCSRCKSVKYCCPEHQKLDWKVHKSICTPLVRQEVEETVPLKQTETTALADDKRHCRCMFCGEALVLGSEDEAIDHMRVCVALQEQLASKDQFTVPSMVKEKFTKN